MRIASIDFKPVSVPYTHRENSSQVNRDGVTDVLVKLTTDDGLVGWGESCSGANVESVLEALRAFVPIVRGRNPWNRDALWRDCFRGGIWQFREGTFNFAWAGIDMALCDLCGKACGQPVYNLLGGLRRQTVNYFCYLSYGDLNQVEEDCRKGVAEGFTVFYIKTGVDIEWEVEAIATIRSIIGPKGKIRVDANESWTVSEAIRNLHRLDQWNLDFAEQPVPADPIENMLEVRRKCNVPIASNEGLWRTAETWNVIKRRACDVLCFSPYWVGSIGGFHRLAHSAALEGLSVCKHTHGELGLAAAASHHVLLNLPQIVEGHQHTANMMEDDILREPLPIASKPDWGAIQAPGLGVEVDEEKVEQYHKLYQERGQFLPYILENMAKEDPGWAKP